MAATTYTCEFCKGRSFATQEALTAHLGSVHQKKPVEKASVTSHQCEPCSRAFTQERALFQHATAVHGYNESADRAAVALQRTSGILLGEQPWEFKDRRTVIERDRESGIRIIKDYETLYKATDDEKAPPTPSDVAAATVHASTHGSAATVHGLSCGSCERAFLTVRGLRDHAEAVHQDEALEATYDERRELVSSALRTSLNPTVHPHHYSRHVWCYITDMSDDFVVYQVDGEEFHRKATYSIADDGVVTLGEGVHVRRRSVYETVGSE